MTNHTLLSRSVRIALPLFLFPYIWITTHAQQDTHHALASSTKASSSASATAKPQQIDRARKALVSEAECPTGASFSEIVRRS